MDVKFSIKSTTSLTETLGFIKKYKDCDITISVEYNQFIHNLKDFSILEVLNPTIVLDTWHLDIDIEGIKTIGLEYSLRFFIRYHTSVKHLMSNNLIGIEKIKQIKQMFGIIDLALDIDEMPDVHILSDKIESIGFKHIDFAIKPDKLWSEKIHWLRNFQSVSYDKNYLIYNLFKTLKNLTSLQDIKGIEEQKEIIEKDLKSNIYIDENLNFMSYGVTGENLIYPTSLTLKSHAQDIEKKLKEISKKIIISYLKDKSCIDCGFKNVCMLAGGYALKSQIYINQECPIGIKDNFEALQTNRGKKEYLTGAEDDLYPSYLTRNCLENCTYK